MDKDLKDEHKVNEQDGFSEGTVKRLNAYYEVLKDYQRVSTPDKEALADLVIKAKGPRRSMRQFASELNVNPSTLSRIVNKKTQGANSDTLIADIAAAADPDSGVTFPILMEAHGMVAKDGSYRVGRGKYEQSIQRIITDELFKRKYSIELVENQDILGIGRRFHPDFTIKTNALCDEENGLWAIDSISLRPAPEDHLNWMMLSDKIMRIMGVLYVGGNPFSRISLAINSTGPIDWLKKRMESFGPTKIVDEISIIVVDLEKGCVVEEYVLPMKNQREMPDIFYDLPEVVSTENDEEDDVEIEDDSIWEDCE